MPKFTTPCSANVTRTRPDRGVALKTPHPCHKRGVVEVGGKWFCKVHDPAYAAMSKAKYLAKVEADRVALMARAQLNRAAPDLLAAAEMALKLINDMMPGVAHIALQDYRLLNEAPLSLIAAIAKAKGET